MDMKRMLSLCIAVVLTTSLIGCSKNDSDKDSRLVGLSFQTSGYSTVMSYLFNYYYHVMEFESANSGYAYWTDRNGAQNGTDGDFTYILEYPDLYVTQNGKQTHYRFKDSRAFAIVKDDGSLNSLFTYYKK